jgi:hypothetical protein
MAAILVRSLISSSLVWDMSKAVKYVFASRLPKSWDMLGRFTISSNSSILVIVMVLVLILKAYFYLAHFFLLQLEYSLVARAYVQALFGLA